jgi:hypothetical protein
VAKRVNSDNYNEDEIIKHDEEYDPDISKISLDDWFTIDFEKDILHRKNVGITKESFMVDVKSWSEAISSLPKFSENSYRKEIYEMDFNIPAEEFDFEVLQGVYSRLVSFFDRLLQMKSTVYKHFETYNMAYKSLKLSSMALYAGTAKDKEASAEHLTHSLYIGTLMPKILLTHIADNIATIEFAAINMNRVLRERELTEKMDNVHKTEGMTHNFNKLAQKTNEEFNKTQKDIENSDEEDWKEN